MTRHTIISGLIAMFVLSNPLGGQEKPSQFSIQNGDVNGDGGLDVINPVLLLVYLFQGGVAPLPIEPDGGPCDSDNDGIGDACERAGDDQGPDEEQNPRDPYEGSPEEEFEFMRRALEPRLLTTFPRHHLDLDPQREVIIPDWGDNAIGGGGPGSAGNTYDSGLEGTRLTTPGEGHLQR